MKRLPCKSVPKDPPLEIRMALWTRVVARHDALVPALRDDAKEGNRVFP